MSDKQIMPVVVGGGMAGRAILQSLEFLSESDPELQLLLPRKAERGIPLAANINERALNVLFLANPSGLHASAILEGARAGFSAIAAEKPVCVRTEEIQPLRCLKVPVGVFHGYRTMWGTRTIKALIESGELGDVFAFESRYWQSSAAQASLRNAVDGKAWKNNIGLNGPHDTLTDLGSHVVDICLHLLGERPSNARCWLSYRNAPAPHRDTHVHLQLEFSDGRRALASISKTVHGSTNDLEYTVLGTRGSATWRFLRPDEVEVGSGNRISLLRRETQNESTGTLPFHALGWLEGYVEITQQVLRIAAGLPSRSIPTLNEALDTMEVLLHAHVER